MVSASVASRSSRLRIWSKYATSSLAAQAHRAGGRCQLAEDQLQQRGLAGAVRADQADLVAAQDRGAEVLDDHACAASPKRRPRRPGAARRRSCRWARRRRARAAPGRACRGAARAASRSSAAARCGRRCACGAPRRPCASSTSSCASSLSARALASASAASCSSFSGLEGGEVARVAAQPAAVELDDARRHRVEEGAVVRDQHDAAAEADEQLLQPDDRVEVEVVGRLVEQQQRRARRPAPAPAQRAFWCRRTACRWARRRPGCSRCSVSSTRCSQVQRVERLDARLQRVEVVAGVVLPRSARAAPRASARPSPTTSKTLCRGVERRLLRHLAAGAAPASSAAGRRRASPARPGPSAATTCRRRCGRSARAARRPPARRGAVEQRRHGRRRGGHWSATAGPSSARAAGRRLRINVDYRQPPSAPTRPA